MTFWRQWDRYWFTPQRPLNLGICRILFFALMIILYGSASLGSLAQVNESSAFWSPNWLFGAVDRILHDRAHLSIVANSAMMMVLAWTWKIAPWSPSARAASTGSIPCQKKCDGSRFAPSSGPTRPRSRSSVSGL